MVADMVEFVMGERPVEDAVAIDFAVEGLRDEMASKLMPVPGTAGNERNVGFALRAKAKDLFDVGAVVDRCDLAQAVIVAPKDGLLVQGGSPLPAS